MISRVFILSLFISSVTTISGQSLPDRMYVCIIGNMEGERLVARNGAFHFSITGLRQTDAAFVVGGKDSAERKHFVRQTTFSIKRKKKFVNASFQLELPPGYADYLVLSRNPSSSKLKPFDLYWSAVEPKTKFAEVQSNLHPDSVTMKLSVPNVSFESGSEKFDSAFVHRSGFLPGQLIPIWMRLEPNQALVDSIPGIYVSVDKAKVYFAINDQPLTETTYANEEFILIRWAQDFSNRPGARIVFRIRYLYKKGDEVIDTGFIEKDVKLW